MSRNPEYSKTLACLVLTVQEMDVTIRHKSGKKNSNADALYCCPADIKHESLGEKPSDVDESQVCSVEGLVKDQVSMPGLMEVAMPQQNDFDMAAMITYLKSGTLPDDEKRSRQIVLESKQFELVDDVLYHENPVSPGRWCLVVPKIFWTKLLAQAHQGGRFTGHLSERKTYDRQRRYVRNDVISICKSCLVCATRKGGRKTL